MGSQSHWPWAELFIKLINWVNLQYRDYIARCIVLSVSCEVENSSVCFNQHEDYIKILPHPELSILDGLITYQTITISSSQDIIETIPPQLSSLEFNITRQEETTFGKLTWVQRGKLNEAFPKTKAGLVLWMTVQRPYQTL